ncbi:MAG: cellulose biosynthesis cyclic di-GMP-binding regulatory protein BcsB [Chloroflexota bacterium]
MNKLAYIFILSLTSAGLLLGMTYSNGFAQAATETPTPEPGAIPLALDLRLLPEPIYQLGSTTPAASALVVPDSPSADEIRAALIVSASFGRMSRGKMPLSLLTASQLAASLWTSQHLIFVGKPAAFPMLSQVSLPAPVSGTTFVSSEIQPEDGILQMTISPWDNTKVILVVGGNTDAGVVKAAQALSVGSIQTGSYPNLAIVANVHAGSSMIEKAETSVLSTITERTFGDLGYDSKMVTGVGTSTAEFQFDLTPGFIAAENPYLDLVFSSSTLLDYTRSGLVIFINGRVIGSARFSDETAQITVLRINIPQGFINAGNNTLSVEINLSPLSGSLGESFGVWATIYSASILHVPLAPATTTSTDLRDLSKYPYPFINDPTLSNVAFILPEQSPTAWEVAAQIAFNLGRSVAGAPFYLRAVYDKQIPDEVRQNYDWILIGLPMELQVMKELRDALPAPFEENSNNAILTKQQVEYRLPKDTQLGYLELLPAPWNHTRTILAIVGNTEAGIRQAGNALTIPILRNKLKGDLAIITGVLISSTDTRTRSVEESISPSVSPEVPSVEVTPIPLQPASPIVPTRTVATRDWIPLAILVLIVLMVILLTVVMVTGAKRNKSGS